MSTTRGQQLIGKELGSCTLEKLLGYGGSSAVFLAQQHTPHRKVAVKVFLPRSTMDMQRTFYSRFLHEAEAASDLDHPTILPIYAYGEQDGWPYIIMPYMPGGTLAEYIEKNGPLSLDEAQLYLEQLASALDYAHAHGCVHCDVKPANILLDGEGHAMLSDFGIARLTQDSPNKHELRHNADTLLGTPGYISPEQALGQHLDGHSDVYSLGITLFYLLTGSTPFTAENHIAMALLHVHEPPPLLGTIRGDSTPQIDLVIGKALSKWPEQRYQTAGEFSDAFAEAVDNVGDNPQIKPLWKRPFKLSQVIFASFLLLILLSGSAFYPTHIRAPFRIPKTDDLLNIEDAWPTSSNYFFDEKGQYHIRNTSSKTTTDALYTGEQFTNFRLQVTTSEVAGTQKDFYGVILRSAVDQSDYYLFEVSAARGGEFNFLHYNDGWSPALTDGPVPSLNAIGQRNTIVVEARGQTFTFSINGKTVGTYTDRSTSAYAKGEIGLYVEEQNTEVAFSHLQIQKL